MKRWYLLIFTILCSAAWVIIYSMDFYKMVPPGSVFDYIWIPALLITAAIPFIGIYQILNRKKGYRRTAWASIIIWVVVMYLVANHLS